MSKLEKIRPAVIDDEDDAIQRRNDDDDREFRGSDDDDDVDEEQHAKLIDAISQMGGKRKRKVMQRTEPVMKVAEYALAGVGTGGGDDDDGEGPTTKAKISVKDLLQAMSKKPRTAVLEKSLKQAQKRGKTLEAPLEKPQAERVLRSVGYEKVKEEVSKWDAVVKGHRRADQIVYPLNQTAIKLPTAEEFGRKFRAETPLERQISQLLGAAAGRHVQSADDDLTPAEKEALSCLSLKEALERRRELARVRALQSYQEAKARRQNKIKSKKYHRLLKRQKMKEHMKEFEALQRSDPDAALEKLRELEKQRVEERMTLKHKGAGKWAKMQAIRAKYDDSAREALADQLRLGKEMTRKIETSNAANGDDDDDDEDDGKSLESDSEEGEVQHRPSAAGNPWLGGDAADGAASGPGYRKLWTEINESRQLRQEMEKEATKKDDKDGDDEDEDDDDEEEEEQDQQPPADPEMANRPSDELDEGLERRGRLEDFEQVAVVPAPKAAPAPPATKATAKAKAKVKAEDVDIDPNKFLTAKPLRSTAPVTELGDDEDEEIDQEAQQRRMTLAGAFADDDVVAEFKEEKRRAVEAARPAALDLTLPGWGDWGGAGLKVSKRKKKRFIIRPPEPPPRNDANRGHLLLHQEPVESVRSRQVSELPFPFRSVAAFESSVRAPVTATFVPQAAVRKLAEPRVITKMGTAIPAMTRDILVASSAGKDDAAAAAAAAATGDSGRKKAVSAKKGPAPRKAAASAFKPAPKWQDKVRGGKKRK